MEHLPSVRTWCLSPCSVEINFPLDRSHERQVTGVTDENQSPSCSTLMLGYVWSFYPLGFGRGRLGAGSAGWQRGLAPPGGVQVAWPLGSDSPHGHDCGFHGNPNPHLTGNGADSVCVWDVFSGLLTDLCILRFSSQ